jgi:predicted Zn finger-like uncharacterized protein
MKIVCDNCATKYSIADEKVRGKVFKIRCKKCSHIIVVRGGEGAAATAEPPHDAAGFPAEEPSARLGTPAPSSSPNLGTGEAVWHLVVDREQIGPLTKEEVGAKFRGGEVDLETYAWREGFADWLRLGSIEDFKDLAGASSDGATRRTDTADLFSTPAPGPSQDDAPTTADLFSGHNAPSAPTGEAPIPAAAAASDMFSGGGNALFSAPQAQAAAPASAGRPARAAAPGMGGGAAMAAAEPAADAAAGSGKMTGQRNENSVLFSLNNLQALASGSGGAAKPAAGGAAPESRPGFANSQTEGSGLIDIRAMAASTLSAGPSPSSGKADEPSFASAPLFSPVAAPILMPAAPTGPPKWIWALLAVGVLAVVGIVVVGILFITKKEPPPQVIVQAPPVAPAAVPGAAPGTPAAVPGTPPGAPAAAVPGAPPGTPVAAAEAPKEHHKSSSKSPKATTPGAAAAPAAAAVPAAAAAKAAPKKKGGGDELDDLLNNAAPDKPSAPKHSAPKEDAGGGADLPDSLSKSDIVNGMGKVKGKVGECYGQFKVPGMANVTVTIGRNGHVSSASVSGSFAGTPTGACVERAVKTATFGQFKGSPQTINYPFMLR